MTERPQDSGGPIRSSILVDLGGTTKAGSSTERALRLALDAVTALGATPRLFDGEYLSHLPHDAPDNPVRSAEDRALIDAAREADALIVASPGYHGGVSGLVKNAIDLPEDTARDGRAYLENMPVLLIATAHGWQAATSTIAGLRAIMHPLRAWPTPSGATINSAGGHFDPDGSCTDSAVADQLSLLAAQLRGFVHRRNSGTLK